MGKAASPYPSGHLRLYKTSRQKADKPLTVQLEYAVNSYAIRRSTGISCLEADWNPKENKGRGGVRASYGTDYRNVNKRLAHKLDEIDSRVADWCEKHPRQLTVDMLKALVDNLPITREDKGIDFCQYVNELLKNEYDRNKIGHSVYKNGLSGMTIFSQFLQSEKLGTYACDKIYVSEISTSLIERYIKYRREVKHNGDETINHALTPILKGCRQAMIDGYISSQLSYAIQGMRIIKKVSLEKEEATKVKHLTKDQIAKLIDFYHNDKEPRRREYVEMFLFAMYACGLRLVDIISLQWSDIDLEKKTLNKIQVKTRNRNVMPLTQQALSILKTWEGRHERFVFGLLPDDINLDDAASFYSRRNTKTKGINQSLTVIGEKLGLPFDLTFHVARHTFAVQSLDNGVPMTMVSQFLGHSSTQITEKVYAHFMPAKMLDELSKISLPFL
ncbi:MAG: site-specific integrase [Muribaculum sp.]|nr:site-specific integrase [Muribaculum sp.]